MAIVYISQSVIRRLTATRVYAMSVHARAFLLSLISCACNTHLGPIRNNRPLDRPDNLHTISFKGPLVGISM